MARGPLLRLGRVLIKRTATRPRHGRSRHGRSSQARFNIGARRDDAAPLNDRAGALVRVMAITDFRSLSRVTGVTVIAASPALRVAAIAAIHAAALLAICLTEYGPFARRWRG